MAVNLLLMHITVIFTKQVPFSMTFVLTVELCICIAFDRLGAENVSCAGF